MAGVSLAIRASEPPPPQILITKTLIFSSITVLTSTKKTFNKENFVEEFSNINWNKLENEGEDVDSKFAFLYIEIFRRVTTYAPFTRVSPEALSFRSKPWITARIQRMMSKRDKYLSKFRKIKSCDTE